MIDLAEKGPCHCTPPDAAVSSLCLQEQLDFPLREDPHGLPLIAWAGYDHLQLAKADEARQMVRTIEEVRGCQPPARKTARRAARMQSKKE
jgi:hypothetical protein